MAALARAMERTARFKQLLADSEWDAIVARSGKNVVYLSSLPISGTLARLQDFPDSPRFALVVWPREGAATLIVTRLHEDVTRARSLIADVRAYTEYMETALELLADVLREKGLAGRRVGVEKGAFGAVQWEALRRLLPDTSWADCSDFLNHARAVKTPSEVAWLKEAADRMDDAFLEVFGSARVGDTERELHNRTLCGLLERGADGPHGVFQGIGDRFVEFQGEGEVALQPGMVIHTDYVAYFDGYGANLSRNAVVGEPPAQKRQAYRDVLEVERWAVDTYLQPGVRACDIYNACGRALAERGYTQTTPILGHSIGLIYHQEAPILHPGETWPLEANMVVVLEPSIDAYHIQDEILITHAGPRLLSDRFNTDEMFVIG